MANIHKNLNFIQIDGREAYFEYSNENILTVKFSADLQENEWQEERYGHGLGYETLSERKVGEITILSTSLGGSKLHFLPKDLKKIEQEIRAMLEEDVDYFEFKKTA